MDSNNDTNLRIHLGGTTKQQAKEETCGQDTENNGSTRNQHQQN